MRKLKYRFSRQALNQMYVSYVRPILEYSSIVWDGCSEQDKTALERLQNEAARIVTGLTKSTSTVTCIRNVAGIPFRKEDIFKKCASCISAPTTSFRTIYLILFHHLLERSQTIPCVIDKILQACIRVQKYLENPAFHQLCLIGIILTMV